MIAAAAQLKTRVLSWQLAFSLGTATIVSLSLPPLLLLDAAVGGRVARTLAYALGAASVLAIARGWWLLRRHRLCCARWRWALGPSSSSTCSSSPGSRRD